MKYLSLFLLLVSSFCYVTAQQQTPNVFYVGNSYTYVNNLPALVDSVAQSTGRQYKHDSNTPGGCTFATHCTNTSMTKIRQGGWDFVVLQEQSQLPSFPQNQVEVECLPYAKQLADSVKAHGGMPMFYMTWGRKNGDAQNAVYFPVLGTYEGMDSMLYERYMKMAIDNKSAVCPVGRVWRYLRTNNPDIELYDTDGSHPSMAGSYAAACSFYVMIFNADPDSIKYDAGLKDSTAINIRTAVRTVVYDSYDYWIDPASFQPQDTTGGDTTGGDTIVTSLITLYDETLTLWPNPVSDIIYAQGDFIIMDMNGRVVLMGRDSADVSSLIPGCYFVRLTAVNRKTQALRFIKK